MNVHFIAAAAILAASAIGCGASATTRSTFADTSAKIQGAFDARTSSVDAHGKISAHIMSGGTPRSTCQRELERLSVNGAQLSESNALVSASWSGHDFIGHVRCAWQHEVNGPVVVVSGVARTGEQSSGSFAENVQMALIAAKSNSF